jgi:hypothetical protein
MKSALFISALLLASVLSYGQRQDSVLMRAYQTKSIATLSKFFNQWADETPSLSAAEREMLNDTLQNVYALFEQFYNPLDLKKVGGSEWGNDIYKKAHFLLVQDRIRFGFVDTLDKDLLLQKVYAEAASYLNITVDSVIKASKDPGNERWMTIPDWPKPNKYDSVIDFRPMVLFAYPKTVVLIERYRDLLNRFLGDQHLPFAAHNIMAPARSKGESQRRKQFLEQYIKIWYGHWGGYWQLHSYPAVGSITFDRTFQHAVINYVLVYEGGYAYFTKKGGVWTLGDARRTWIE